MHYTVYYVIGPFNDWTFLDILTLNRWAPPSVLSQMFFILLSPFSLTYLFLCHLHFVESLYYCICIFLVCFIFFYSGQKCIDCAFVVPQANGLKRRKNATPNLNKMS